LLATYNKDEPFAVPLTSDASIIQRELKMLKPTDANDHQSAMQNVLSYLQLYRLSRGFDRLGEVLAFKLINREYIQQSVIQL
jgi:hypothetical protein